ncbi:MAG: glycoside hydrolase family 99-like domain-containing protein [Sphingobacteriaceae bacterium]
MKPRLIAYYLPQFYPFKENNEWWGDGFTEWTNVGKATPLFKGHYQPRVPADLGYYDLRLPEIREMQAKMALEAGIEGFCYWHYWFGNGKRLLNRVFDEVLSDKKPDIPFCLGWANETWSGVWHGLDKKILIKQEYPGKEDVEKHFYAVLPAFLDSRYIRVDNKPAFQIYQPLKLPQQQEFISLWNNLALKNGLEGVHFIAHTNRFEEYNELIKLGFDAVNLVRLGDILRYERSLLEKIMNKLMFDKALKVYNYGTASKYFTGKEEINENCYPTIIPNWDHSPRSGRKGFILHESNPELFKKHVKNVLELIEHKTAQHKIVFVKSWNEWGEGNYLEPDLKYGRKYLDVLRDLLK